MNRIRQRHPRTCLGRRSEHRRLRLRLQVLLDFAMLDVFPLPTTERRGEQFLRLAQRQRIPIRPPMDFQRLRFEGTNSTTSNVVYQAEILDSRGHEANDTSEREDVRRGLYLAQKGCRQTLARCRYHELGDCPCAGENCSEGHSGSAEEIGLDEAAHQTQNGTDSDGAKIGDRTTQRTHDTSQCLLFP